MKGKEFNWGPGLFLIIYQCVLLAVLPFYFCLGALHWQTALLAFILFFITGISITAGYHRYFAHKAFKAHRIVETVLLFFGSMSVQGSALRWSNDHRLHHAFVDTDRDPYTITKGFWYAHFSWLLEKPEPIEPKLVADLMRNKRVAFQHRHAEALMIGTNVFVFLISGWLLGDFLGAFFLVTWLRMFALHHFTWFINSLCHTWGDKPFCQEQTAVNNFILSFLTFGEGYHNYHHTFASDYRNGIRWYHFDPTKWTIWVLAKLKLASGLRRMDPVTIKKKLINERKNLLMEQLSHLWYVKREALEDAVETLSNQMLEKLARFSELKRSASLKPELKALRKSLREDWRHWRALSHQILHMRVIPAV